MTGKTTLLCFIAVWLTACSSGDEHLTVKQVLERTSLVQGYGGPKISSCEHMCTGWSPYSKDEAARRIDSKASWTTESQFSTLKFSGPKVLIRIDDAPSGSVIEVTNLEGTEEFNPSNKE